MLSDTFFSQNAVLLPVKSHSLIDKRGKKGFQTPKQKYIWEIQQSKELSKGMRRQ